MAQTKITFLAQPPTHKAGIPLNKQLYTTGILQPGPPVRREISSTMSWGKLTLKWANAPMGTLMKVANRYNSMEIIYKKMGLTGLLIHRQVSQYRQLLKTLIELGDCRHIRLFWTLKKFLTGKSAQMSNLCIIIKEWRRLEHIVCSSTIGISRMSLKTLLSLESGGTNLKKTIKRV